MTCPSVEELTALYDGGLPKVRADKLRDHVARCPRCVLEIRRLNEILSAGPEQVAPPAGLLARVLAEPDSHSAKTPHSSRSRSHPRPFQPAKR